MDWYLPLTVWGLAYLAGSIPFGYLVARAKGIDIFQHGSGNIGATNVGRVLGSKYGIAVLVLDFLKGAIPTAVATWLARDATEGLWARGLLETGAALAAFLGHLFSAFLRLRGGKGVAAGAGAVFVLLPLPASVGLVGFASTALASRYVSLGSIVGGVALAAAQLGVAAERGLGEPRTLFALAAGAMVALRHRSNLSRICAGTEGQMKPRPRVAAFARSVHVMALGLWFGMGVFFSLIAAPALFRDFQKTTSLPADERPDWLPLPAAYTRVADPFDGPKEQGSRVAGHAVSGMFPTYYLVQAFAGFAAMGTALGFASGRVGRVRVWCVGLALAAAVAGWAMDRPIASLRHERNAAVGAYLQGDDASLREPAVAARSRFFAWHQTSLFLNLGCLVLVAVATALAGSLPPREGE